MATKDLLTMRQAGEAYPGIGFRQFRQLVAERRIPVHRIGRKVLLDPDDIESFIHACRHEAVS